MKFYDRIKELKELRNIQDSTKEHAQMTVLVGRRRIGKTKLLFRATSEKATLYFFVARKAEALLCRDFIDEITTVLHIPIYGQPSTVKDIFHLLMEYSKGHSFNLIIDEFQEFYTINPSVYSDIQNLWDRYKDESHLCLFLSGSIYSLMHRIFEGAHEPLFGRATNRIVLQPFSTMTLKEILRDNHPDFTPEDLLALYTFTGGVPKYIELLIDNKAFTRNKMIDFICRENSLFLSEGKNLLIEEFGKDYTVYFSIMACIAAGFTGRTAIESYLRKEIGGYLTRLENDFNLIKKHTPVFSKKESRNVKYILEDKFLRFWFRFIYKYSRFLETGAYSQLKDIILRDYPTFSGTALEDYFRRQFCETGNYTEIGSWWNRKGEDEIDLVAIDEINKQAVIAEIKRNRKNIRMELLHQKALALQKKLQGYDIIYKGLDMEDM